MEKLSDEGVGYLGNKIGGNVQKVCRELLAAITITAAIASGDE